MVTVGAASLSVIVPTAVVSGEPTDHWSSVLVTAVDTQQERLIELVCRGRTVVDTLTVASVAAGGDRRCVARQRHIVTVSCR